MIIKGVEGKKINDSRGEFTIEVLIETDVGKFSASAPNGKSKGKFETKSYKISIDEDIKSLSKLSDYFSKEHIESFEDLKYIEDIVKGHIGGNTLFALESAVLKGIAFEKKIEIWQVINPWSKKIPRLVGNCIGGGLHSKELDNKRPDFQEFLLIPKTDSALEGFKTNLKIKKFSGQLLKKTDLKFKGDLNDENAWITSLNEKQILEILTQEEIEIGVDIAASSFYKRKKYHYKNPLLSRDVEEQLKYILNLIKNFKIFYCEDPFDEEDFSSHSRLLKFVGDKCLIIGDDLTVTNYKRLKKAIDEKSINALIMKPNQNGSLLDVAKVATLAKENKIKMIFSHRSGETMENILADLAVGFEADFIKCGITGEVREAKIKRLVEIEKQILKRK